MKIESGHYYHIYNRGVNSRNIFFTDTDFDHFLDKYTYYLGLSFQTLAYCLMANHFHFLVKVLSVNEEQEAISNHKKINSTKKYYILPNPKNRVFKIENLLSHLFNSHTKYINSKHKRTGTLWDGNFKIRIIDTNEYIQKCICYIHRNPIHHGLTSSYGVYPYSSFSKVLSNIDDIIDSSATLALFGSIKNFEAAHSEMQNTLDSDYRLE